MDWRNIGLKILLQHSYLHRTCPWDPFAQTHHPRLKCWRLSKIWNICIFVSYILWQHIRIRAFQRRCATDVLTQEILHQGGQFQLRPPQCLKSPRVLFPEPGNSKNGLFWNHPRFHNCELLFLRLFNLNLSSLDVKTEQVDGGVAHSKKEAGWRETQWKYCQILLKRETQWKYCQRD